jgi:hypothetical protein
MVLFDQIIEIFRRPYLRALGQQAISVHLAQGPVRGGMPIERDRLVLPHAPRPEAFQCPVFRLMVWPVAMSQDKGLVRSYPNDLDAALAPSE